ncbi:MAG TPA: DUF2339 domain-containing protein [Bryobacteraceae bacterium]
MGATAFLLFVAAALAGCLILLLVAFVRTGKIQTLDRRLTSVEAALLRLTQRPATPAEAAQTPAETPATIVQPAAGDPAPTVEPVPPPLPDVSTPDEHLELIIGRKWIGWIAIVLILGATVYFLKYAFENRWIGELGRVTLGVVAGFILVLAGHERYRKGWRYLSQILTAGGITVLYLSVYGAFGYYHLIDQRSAFVFLAIIVAEAHLLALAYNAPSIAVMALVGGFLSPLLLSTGRDQYRVLFTYIGVLDMGMLGVVIARSWRWIGSLAYVGTQCLFWAWYTEHYHPEKRLAALLFQAVIFLLFVLADLAPHLRRNAAGWEEWVRLAVNPFVFYFICYSLLNGDYHDWMAVLALALAIVYAALARLELALRPSDRRMLLVTLGTALTFVTLAIPIQLESNWITIAWGLEAVILLWVGFETTAKPLRLLSAIVFSLALFRFLFEDMPREHRALFTPVFNRYFLGMLALVACLGCAAHLYWRFGARAGSDPRAVLAIGLLAFGVLWLGSTVEAYGYFGMRADNIAKGGTPDVFEAAKQLRWGGQLSVSLLWSAYAGLLTLAGFRRKIRPLRVAGLILFGITLAKAVFVDISELRQFYRIVALLSLGLVLLGVAWAYQRSTRQEQT